MQRLKHPLERAEKETFWALKDITFDIYQGDVVGLIGRNGAGKSTLLKIISRITRPSAGEVALYGRVGSLLEVGTGFHPELTGRENIYLNGAVLGMTRREITRQFDAIVEFAGVEKFLDTPVKRYSSGMSVRLAFAVAAHLDTEIMLVDEVLAVGDVNFQKRCLGKMKDVANSGRTVLFVSHDMQAISLLCGKAITLGDGQITYMGETQNAIDHYLNSFAKPSHHDSQPEHRSGSGEYRITSINPSKPIFSGEERKVFHFTIERRKPQISHMFLQAVIVDSLGTALMQCDSRLVGHWVENADCIEGTFSFTTPWLKPGSYRMHMYIYTVAAAIDRYEDACTFEVSPILPYPHPANDGTDRGVVFAEFDWCSHSVEPLSALKDFFPNRS